jgi:hypothetical protein
MNKWTVPIMVALIAALATVGAAWVTSHPQSSKRTSTPDIFIPPTALEAELAKGNVSLTEVPDKESLVRQWLINDPQYQTMAQTILTALAGKRVINPIPLDVTIAKYRVALGGSPDSTFAADQYKDIEKTKTAMFDTWKERHPDFPQKSFDEIVEIGK